LTGICYSPGEEVLLKAFDESFDAASDLWLLNTSKLKSMVNRNGTSRLVRSSFQSLALPIALEKCFGHLSEPLKSKTKNAFLLKLMIYDFLGNSAGLVTGSMGLAKLGGIVFKTVTRFGLGPIGRYAQENLKFSAQQLTRLKRMAFFLVPTAVGAFSFKSNLVEIRKNDSLELKALNSLVENLRQDIQTKKQIESALKTSNDQEFWAEASQTINKQIDSKCKDFIQLQISSLNVKDLSDYCGIQ
jgi:hypothetical protein